MRLSERGRVDVGAVTLYWSVMGETLKIGIYGPANRRMNFDRVWLALERLLEIRLHLQHGPPSIRADRLFLEQQRLRPELAAKIEERMSKLESGE